MIVRDDWSALKKLIYLRGSGAGGGAGGWSTISGNPVTFSAKAAPLKQLQIAFSPVQSGTGDPSPDNVRPISGWDGVTVEQTSEILAELTSSASANGVTCTTNSDGSVTVKGTCTGNATLDFFRNSSAFPTGISAGGKYVVSIENPVDAFDVLSYKGVSATTLVSFSNADHAEFTVPSDATGMLIRILAKQGVTYDTTLHVRICQYDGYRSISISFGQTVYGGTLDVVNGKMTVDRAKIVYNGSETWYSYGTQGYYISRNDMAKANRYKGILKSDILPTYQSNYGGDFLSAQYGIVGWDNLTSPNQNYIYVKCGEVTATDPTVIKAWLQENPLTVTYELATPFELTLTPEQISTLQGTNNVWSDANGDLTVEYRSN